MTESDKRLTIDEPVACLKVSQARFDAMTQNDKTPASKIGGQSRNDRYKVVVEVNEYSTSPKKAGKQHND